MGSREGRKGGSAAYLGLVFKPETAVILNGHGFEKKGTKHSAYNIK